MRARNQTISLIASAVGLLATPLAAPTISAKRFRSRKGGDGDDSTTGTGTGATITVAPEDEFAATGSTAPTDEHAITIANLKQPAAPVQDGALERTLEQIEAGSEVTPAERAAMDAFVKIDERFQAKKNPESMEMMKEWLRNRVAWMEYKVANAKKDVAPALLRLTLIVMTLLSVVVPILASVMYYQKSTNPCGETPPGEMAPHDQCFRPQAVQNAMCADITDSYDLNDCVRNARASISEPPIYTPRAQVELAATAYIWSLPLTLTLIACVSDTNGPILFVGVVMFIVKMVENAWTINHFMTETGDENYNLALTNILSTVWALLFVPTSIGYLYPKIAEWQESLPRLPPPSDS